ncbi:MAG: dihydroorotate dehydrogenase electron transfer subunit, partial [Phycisphaerae bacterium]
TLGGAAEVSADGSPTPSVVEFAQHGVETAIATDDGSLGWKGFAAGLFTRWLEAQDGPADRLVVYSCGPEPMMRAVGEACIARGIECQLALERHMACGMGTCQSCIVKLRARGEPGWQYKLVCTDGPVFNAEDILWD